MERRDILQMSIVIGISFIVFLFLSGWLPPRTSYNPQIIAQSDNWELSSKIDAAYTPYFIYKQTGTGTVECNLHIRGVGFYEIIDKSKSIKMERGIDEFVQPHHYGVSQVLGENRWYLENISNIRAFETACCKVTWSIDGKTFSEYVVSDSLSEEEIAQIKSSWIESDSKYYDNPLSGE